MESKRFKNTGLDSYRNGIKGRSQSLAGGVYKKSPKLNILLHFHDVLVHARLVNTFRKNVYNIHDFLNSV